PGHHRFRRGPGAVRAVERRTRGGRQRQHLPGRRRSDLDLGDVAMPQTLWSAPVGPLNNASGPAVTAAALTDASPAPPIIIPAGLLNVGTELRIRAHGEFTVASGTPACIFGLYWGGIAGVVLTATASLTLPVGTGFPWMLEWDGEVRGLSTSAGGNTGSVNGQGKFHLGATLSTYG